MSRTSKLITLTAAAALVTDGLTVAIGGILDRRRPLALCRALAERRVDGLHVMSFLAGEETEILATTGAVAALTTGYVDPRAHPKAIEAGIATGTIDLREMSEHLFVAGLQAAASGLPCWPTLGGLGSDVVASLDLADIICPYTGQKMLAVPAAHVDVALIHAAAATATGDVIGPRAREFLDDADLVLARAAHRVIVTADRIVDATDVSGGHLAVLASFEVDAVVHTPEGGSK
jgi:glutaconate CoA-transferase subunit A